MIRQSESAMCGGSSASGDVRGDEQRDNALWAHTGWVHVEKDIDFSDPKVSENVI